MAKMSLLEREKRWKQGKISVCVKRDIFGKYCVLVNGEGINLDTKIIDGEPVHYDLGCCRNKGSAKHYAQRVRELLKGWEYKTDEVKTVNYLRNEFLKDLN